MILSKHYDKNTKLEWQWAGYIDHIQDTIGTKKFCKHVPEYGVRVGPLQDGDNFVKVVGNHWMRAVRTGCCRELWGRPITSSERFHLLMINITNICFTQ